MLQTLLMSTYLQVTSLRGPAMSDSMYAIGWLELKEFDKAYADFTKMFQHVAGVFQVNELTAVFKSNSEISNNRLVT